MVLRWQYRGQIYSTSHDPWNTALEAFGFPAITLFCALFPWLSPEIPCPQTNTKWWSVVHDFSLLQSTFPQYPSAQSGDKTMCVLQPTHQRQLDHSFYPRSILSLISDCCASPITIKSPVPGNTSANTTYPLIILRLDDVKKTGFRNAQYNLRCVCRRWLLHKVRGILFFYHAGKKIIEIF